MNKQEIFNTVAKHLFEQGERASSGDGSCKYRTTNAGGKVLKCAVGALLSDDLYVAAMDTEYEGTEEQDDYSNTLHLGSAVTDIVKRAAMGEFKLPYWFVANPDFLGKLQHVHDSVMNWHDEDRMKNALRNAAHDEYLDTSILDTLSFAQKEERTEASFDPVAA